MFTYDTTTLRGQVRLLIPDTSTTDYVFEDDEIDLFLSLQTDVYRSAALALETIASDHAKTLKVIRILDLQTDGAKSSEALIKRAKLLRVLAKEAEESEDGGIFDVVEMVPNAFGYRERIYNDALRTL